MNHAAIARKLVPVIYEDEQFLFVNKPAGLPSRGAGKADAPEWLAALVGSREQMAAYQLPAGQSGVLGFAKSAAAHRHLVTGIETGSVRSAFVAVAEGRITKRAGVVSGAVKKIGPDRFVADRAGREEDAPSTIIETVSRGTDRVLLRCRPSGLDDRQVRAHLNAARLVLVGERRPEPRARSRTAPKGKKIAHRSHRAPSEPSGESAEPSAAARPLLHLEEIRFHHPALKHAISVRAPVPPEFQGALGSDERRGGLDAELALRLHAALSRRLSLLLDEQTDAFRVLHGRADGLGGLAADLYGDVLVLQVLQGKFEADPHRLRAVSEWYRRMLNLRAVYLKQLARDRSRESAPTQASGPLFDPQPLVGEPAEPQFAVLESGLKFLVRPYDGYATGLFLEQRENRRRVRELATGRRVLNLFAHTCGFSVSAAAGGASRTVSVDASRRHLERGKENFAANGLSLENHLFIHDDALNFFKRARRQGLSFDLIVIDPPSFARMKKPRRVFTVLNDLRGLLAEAMTVLEPGGIMLVCTNLREAGRGWLRDQVNLAAGERKVLPLATTDLPLDFAGDPDYAKSVLVRIS